VVCQFPRWTSKWNKMGGRVSAGPAAHAPVSAILARMAVSRAFWRVRVVARVAVVAVLPVLALGLWSASARVAAWAVDPVPTPAAAVYAASLSAVSCTSDKACMAVGTYNDGTNFPYPFAERWDGASWTVEPTVAVRAASFAGVSCGSASYCLAVGYHDVGSHQGPFAESWNGTTWVVRPPRRSREICPSARWLAER